MAEHLNLNERCFLFDLVMGLEREGLLGKMSGEGPQYEVTIKVKRVLHDEYSIDSSRELLTAEKLITGTKDT